jgi:hypothetical protein
LSFAFRKEKDEIEDQIEDWQLMHLLLPVITAPGNYYSHTISADLLQYPSS